MATDVLDEHRFTSQCSLYEPTRSRLTKETKHRPTTTSTTAIFDTASTATAPRRRIKYSTQTSVPLNQTSTTNNSVHNRNSVSTDFMSLIRSFAMKPFRAPSMSNAMTEGQTNHVISGNHTHAKPPVSLLKYRPLSESVSDDTSFTQSTRVCI